MKKMVGILAGLMIMTAGSAWGIPTLTLTSGATTFTVQDGGFGDTQTATGIVGFGGQVGSWNVATTIGANSAGYGVPNIHLGSIDATLLFGQTIFPQAITISFIDTISNEWSGNGLINVIGGVAATGGSATLETRINGDTISQLGPVTGGFSLIDAVNFIASPPDTIELLTTITHTSPGMSSFDWQVNPVPEPSTIILFGAGLLGLGIYSRRRMQK